MLRSRKAQGMSLNVIVVAVIVLIILVVLILIFSGKLKIFSSKTTETTSQYESTKCLVPGTNNECSYDPKECASKGGSYNQIEGGYSDCSSNQCCFM
jgi:uncharacterized membrane protein YqiK